MPRLKSKLSHKSHIITGEQTKLIVQNESAINSSESGEEPVFRLPGRNILNNYIYVTQIPESEKI